MTLTSRKATGYAALALLAALVLAAPARAEWVWDSDLGWIDMSVQPADSDRGLYGYASGLILRGDVAAASDLLAEMERKYPQSPLLGKAMFARARCEAQLGCRESAARIARDIIRLRPAGVDISAVAAFERDLAQTSTASRETPPQGEAPPKAQSEQGAAPMARHASEFERHMTDADIALKARRFDDARASTQKAFALAENKMQKDRALLMDAMGDLIACREAGHSEERVERAIAALRLVADPVAPIDSPGHAAQEYLSIAESARAETDPRRRALFYAVTWFYEGKPEAQYRTFKDAAKRFKGTFAGETALFYQAESLYRRQKWWGAFKIYEQFAGRYPVTRRSRVVVERQFAIGQKLAERNAHGKVIAAMEAVVKNGPSSPLADDAHMAMGRIYMRQERYESARDAFEAVVQGYPHSEWNTAALYWSGMADLRYSDIARDNEALLTSARRAFEVYLRHDPQGGLAGDARMRLAECREKQALAMMDVGRFYTRRKEPEAAAVQYRLIVRDFPETASAAQAKAALESLAARGVSVQ